MNFQEFVASEIQSRIDQYSGHPISKWPTQEQYFNHLEIVGKTLELILNRENPKYSSDPVNEKEKYKLYTKDHQDMWAKIRGNDFKAIMDFDFNLSFTYENTQGLITYPQIKSLVEFFQTEQINIQGKGNDWDTGATTGHEDYFILSIKSFDKKELLVKYQSKLEELLEEGVGDYTSKIQKFKTEVNKYLEETYPAKSNRISI